MVCFLFKAAPIESNGITGLGVTLKADSWLMEYDSSACDTIKLKVCKRLLLRYNNKNDDRIIKCI